MVETALSERFLFIQNKLLQTHLHLCAGHRTCSQQSKDSQTKPLTTAFLIFQCITRTTDNELTLLAAFFVLEELDLLLALLFLQLLLHPVLLHLPLMLQQLLLMLVRETSTRVNSWLMWGSNPASHDTSPLSRSARVTPD